MQSPYSVSDHISRTRNGLKDLVDEPFNGSDVTISINGVIAFRGCSVSLERGGIIVLFAQKTVAGFHKSLRAFRFVRCSNDGSFGHSGASTFGQRNDGAWI